MKCIILIGLFICFSISAQDIVSQQGNPQGQSLSAKEKGFKIAEKRALLDSGWKDSTADMEMRLISSNGQVVERKLTIYALENQSGGDKSLTVFDLPKDLDGTAFLTFSKIQKPDDQWLFLPALNRVKRISTKNKTGSFMGSEYSYEDLASFELEKYQYKYLFDSIEKDASYFVIEMYPTSVGSGYSKIVSWIEQERYTIHKMEFYDKNKQLIKKQYFKNYQLFNSKYWRAKLTRMENIKTGKATELEWNSYELGAGVNESMFTRSALKRIR